PEEFPATLLWRSVGRYRVTQTRGSDTHRLGRLRAVSGLRAALAHDGCVAPPGGAAARGARIAHREEWHTCLSAPTSRGFCSFRYGDVLAAPHSEHVDSPAHTSRDGSRASSGASVRAVG